MNLVLVEKLELMYYKQELLNPKQVILLLKIFNSPLVHNIEEFFLLEVQLLFILMCHWSGIIKTIKTSNKT